MKRRVSKRFKQQKKSNDFVAMIFLGILLLFLAYIYLDSNGYRITNNNQLFSSSEALKHLNRGNERFETKDYKGAIDSYTEVILLEPNTRWDAYVNRAKCLARFGYLENREKIEKDFDMAFKISPRNPEIYIHRGSLKADFISDHNGAIADYTGGGKIKPNYAIVYYFRGFAYRDRNYGSTFNIPNETEADWKTFLQLTSNGSEKEKREQILNLLAKEKK